MIHFSLLIIRLGEALSDSEIEKNENACAGRRSSTGTSGSNNTGKKSSRPRAVLRRRHNSSSSDGSMLNNVSTLTPLNGVFCDPALQSMIRTSFCLLQYNIVKML